MKRLLWCLCLSLLSLWWVDAFTFAPHSPSIPRRHSTTTTTLGSTTSGGDDKSLVAAQAKNDKGRDARLLASVLGLLSLSGSALVSTGLRTGGTRVGVELIRDLARNPKMIADTLKAQLSPDAIKQQAATALSEADKARVVVQEKVNELSSSVMSLEINDLAVQVDGQLKAIREGVAQVGSTVFTADLSSSVENVQTGLVSLKGQADVFLQNGLQTVDPTVVSLSEKLSSSLQSIDVPGKEQVLPVVLPLLKELSTNPVARVQAEEASLVLAAAVLTAGILKSATSGNKKGFVRSSVELEALKSYDPATLNAYYEARPLVVFQRIIELFAQSNGLLLGLLLDYLTDNLDQNEEKRATQLKSLIAELGPVFIKVGQLGSVRPDLLSETYLKQLQTLQDRVPPFSSVEALAIVEANLPPGKRFEDVYKRRSDFDKAVASASLGQVYKAELIDGTTVAVKVQRPQVLEAVTLDLYVVRMLFSLTATLEPFRKSALGFIDVLDAWGGRFIQELDYLQEAANSKRFGDSMQLVPTVAKTLIVPKVYDDLTSRYVLVSQWVDGQKLSSISRDTQEGKEKLDKVVAVLLNCYLIQLLETGFLHSDPHPGNFLLTPSGQVCVLDYGLMTEIYEDQRIALVEYVAHLTSKDYNATVGDLVTLGFIPEEIGSDPVKRGIVAPVLGSVLEQLSNGGGAKAVSIDKVGAEVEALSKQYPLTIPAWFGLIVRTFSALEGLGLSNDNQYSIVNNCYPYLSRRLLTDDSPRIRAALRSFLYGAQGKQLKVEKVNEMIDAYRKFTTSFEGFTGQKPAPNQPPVTGRPADIMMSNLASSDAFSFDEATVETLQILFSKDGNYVQQLVVEEMVRMADATVREVTGVIVRAAKSNQPALALQGIVPSPLRSTPLGTLLLAPLFPLISVLTVFSLIADRAEIVARMSEEDQESLKTLRRLLDLVNQASSSSLSPSSPQATLQRTAESAIKVLPGVIPLLPEIAPGATQIARQFVRQLTGRVLQRLAEDLDNAPAPSSRIPLASQS